MRLSISAVSVDERRAMPVARQFRMPRRYRRLVIMASGILGGALLWVLYFFLVMRNASPSAYAAAALVGAACGLILVTIPRLIWHFLRKQAYGLLLRQWTDKALVFANAARRDLTSGKTPPGPQQANDLAVVDFLQGDYRAAVGGFETAAEHGAPEPAANLPAALAETAQWQRLEALLRSEQAAHMLPGGTNLARLAATAPDDGPIEPLWGLTQERALRNGDSRGQAILLNNLGVRAMRGGRWPQAARAFELALQRQPAYAYPHANLGALAYRQGDLAQAISQTASAAALMAEDPTALTNLGGLLATAGDARAAERWLLKAQKVEPRSPATLINLANAQRLAGRPTDAIASLDTAVAVASSRTATGQPAESTLALAHYNLALTYHGQGDQPKAVEHLQSALAAAPDDLDTLNNLGCEYFALKQYQKAYGYFERVATLDDAPRHRRNLIRAELGAGRLEQAATLLQAETPASPETDELAFERALVSLLRALQIKPDTETHRQMMEFNLNAAANTLSRVAGRGGSTAAEASFNHGLTQYARGDFRSAGDTIARTLQKSPNPRMTYAAAVCYIMAALRERDQHVGGSEDTLPPSVRELYLKARPYLEKVVEFGVHRPAGIELTAPELHKLAEDAAHDLGLVNYMIGDYPRAIDVFRKIVRSESPPHLLNAIAIAQARQAQELQLTAQTASLMPESRKNEIRQQARGLLAGAIFYFNQALQLTPEAPLAHANMGLALMLRNQTGDVEAALNHWQLMHRHGDARARQTYERFMQAASSQAAQRLRFQDVELVFRPLNVVEWIVFPRPQMSPARYVIHELLDIPEWQFQAGHRLVRRALRYRSRAETVRRKLRRLMI